MELFLILQFLIYADVAQVPIILINMFIYDHFVVDAHWILLHLANKPHHPLPKVICQFNITFSLFGLVHFLEDGVHSLLSLLLLLPLVRIVVVHFSVAASLKTFKNIK